MRLIDADVFMKSIIKKYSCKPLLCGICDNGKFFYGHLHQEIDKAPTIEVEPVKRGKIITATDNKDKTYYQYCSECKKILGFKEYPNYCPNCGAKMEEVECITK